jgi:GNAT superfamily N-acetyltransferase
VYVRPIEKNDAEAFARLMRHNSSPCFCRFWDFVGDKNAWLMQCASEPEKAEDEAKKSIVANDPSSAGVVAFASQAQADSEQPEMLGFCKVSVSAKKVFALAVYRRIAHDYVDTQTAVLGCFFVHPLWRKRGVAEALLAEAIPFAKTLGAARLVALPRRAPPMVHDEEGQFGPESIFQRRGFTEASGGPHPVLTLVL